MGFLIDTNVLSELRKRERGNARVLRWFAEVEESQLYVSVVVIGELRRGAELLRWRDPIGAARLEEWLGTLGQSLGVRLLPITPEIADRWGRLGIPDALPVVDGMITATALVHELTVVTRNTRDMARSGARLLDPFSEAISESE